ncbi:MAG TPA: glycosyltransferase [Thiotrichales bacterium]|nr:glycosyltransferase [Thiotrichales bacterium]
MSNPPHIALFASFSGEGGVERMVLNLAEGMSREGARVDLVLARAEGGHLERPPEGVRMVRLGVDHTWQALGPLRRYLRSERPDALLAAKDRAIRVAVLARRAARPQMPLAGRLGTTVSAALAEKGRLRRALWYGGMRLFYRGVDTLITVSEGVRADVQRITRLPDERFRVIRNPVITPRLERQAAAPLDHPWFREEEPVIVGAGRLTRQKDFPTLLRAFAELRATRPARLVILGEGGMRKRLERLAGELGVAETVAMPGFDPNPHRWIARARLFVLSSAWEGSPNALTEAMALGVPVVSTDCPSGPAELLEGGSVAPLVPVGDPRALAAAMRSALENPPPPERLREAVSEYHQQTSSRAYLAALGHPPEAWQ